MKKMIFAAVVLMALMTSCHVGNFRCSRSQKNLVEDSRQLTGFERIELLGSLDVKYLQADSFSVVVKAPKEVVDKVETRVVNHTLVVNMKGETTLINFGVSDSDDVSVWVTSPDFLGIVVRGSGDFDSESLVDTDTLDIELNGSGDIEFDNIICDRMNVNLVGSGDVEVRNVKTQWADVNLVGSGDIKIKFDDSGVVESSLTGSGDITLKGIVRDFRNQVRGSGDLDTNELHTR